MLKRKRVCLAVDEADHLGWSYKTKDQPLHTVCYSLIIPSLSMLYRFVLSRNITGMAIHLEWNNVLRDAIVAGFKLV